MKKFFGFDINMRNRYGSTLLNKATQNGYLRMVIFLIGKEANLNIPDVTKIYAY